MDCIIVVIIVHVIIVLQRLELIYFQAIISHSFEVKSDTTIVEKLIGWR